MPEPLDTLASILTGPPRVVDTSAETVGTTMQENMEISITTAARAANNFFVFFILTTSCQNVDR
jgi:hypothetical protein